jgi:hypothetical protein
MMLATRVRSIHVVQACPLLLQLTSTLWCSKAVAGLLSADPVCSSRPGFLSGCILSLLITFIVLLTNAGGYDKRGGTDYLNSVFPVFT